MREDHRGLVFLTIILHHLGIYTEGPFQGFQTYIFCKIFLNLNYSHPDFQFAILTLLLHS